MTAVLDVVDCPQCGWSAFYEYQTRTLSTTIFCPRCGYQEETRPNKKRKPALSGVEGTKVDSLIYRTRKRPGWGAYQLKRHNGVSEIGAVHRPLTSRTIARFKQDLKHPEIDATQSFLTRWNRRRQRVEMVVGKFPRDLP
jgi:predicted RNA-binding Zn-ribbon protein involved in translation (DUF1610 family)